MTARASNGRFTAERTPTTVTERVTIEPAGLPSMAQAWAALTAPLDHYQVPVIITDAERAASDVYIDQMRELATADRALLNHWCADAQQATFGPLDDWLHHAPLPQMTP